MTYRRLMIAGTVLISAVFASHSASAGASAARLSPVALAHTAAVNDSLTLVKRKGGKVRGGEFRRGERFQGRKMHRHRFHHRRYHRRHGYKRRWHHHRYRYYGPSIIIAPYGHYGYGSCYRRCRIYHGPRFCRRYWRRYCH